MRVIFMGTPDFSVGTLEEIIKAGHEVVLVVSQPDKAVGRSKALKYTPVKECAIAHGIEVSAGACQGQRMYRVSEIVPCGYYDRGGFWTDYTKGSVRHAKIWLCECTCIATAKISWRSTDPVGCHQRRSVYRSVHTAHGRRC